MTEALDLCLPAGGPSADITMTDPHMPDRHDTPRDRAGRSTRPDGAAADPDVTAEFWGGTPSWRTTGSTPRIRRGSRPATPITPTPLPDDLAWDEPSQMVDRISARTAERDRTEADRTELASLVGTTAAMSEVSDRFAVDDFASDDEVEVGGIAGWFERTGLFTSNQRVTSGQRAGECRQPAATAERTRTHRAVPATSPDDGVSFTGRIARIVSPDGSPLGSVDPLLVRLGVLIALGVLLVPLALALRPSSGEETVRSPSIVASGGLSAGSDRPVALDRLERTEAMGSSPIDDPAGTSASAGADSATTGADAAPDPVVTATPCNSTYEVHPGDYWLRIADEAVVDLADLLAVNAATVETALYPGDDICLPPGALMPSPPTTVAPTTTAPSSTGDSTTGGATSSGSTTNSNSTNNSSSSAATTTAPPRPTTTRPAPATTSPPTTTAPRPAPSSESAEQVKAIIREVWPAELHDRAILVAQRESTLRPSAYNGHCCYGVFQIYWSVHRGWLADHGVTSSAHLLDARTNIEMAYKIYQRSGGWGPWSQTAY